MIHVFGDCELDEELFQLRRRGRVIKLEPKVFDVLAYLVTHCERVVSKDELLDAVWPGQAVSESVLPKCIAAARRGVGDLHGRRKVIATVHGRGYRFVAATSVGTGRAEGDRRSAVADVTAGRGEAVASAPFVGRERALKRLREGLDAAAAAHGRILLLVGEPGIGKTRTSEELAAEARRRGIAVLVGRCVEVEGAPAFWPWVQVLRGCVALNGQRRPAAAAPGLADVAALVPELGGRSPEVPGAPVEQDQQARFRMFDSVVAFLRHTALRQPLVIVLDDLHWADEASLRLLGFLATEIRDAPLLVVATYRDVDVGRGHPLEDLLALLAQQPHCERITLRGLDNADAARFIEGLAGEAAPAELVDAVQEMTEGNPFFIQEIVRLLVSEERLSRPLPAAWSLAVPQSLRAAIGRRLSRLSPACNALLRTASILGREFGGTVLQRLAQLPRRRLLDLLDEAAAARIVDAVPEELDRYAFHHAVIRQTLYDELSTPQRVLLHRRAGEVLEEALGGQPESSLAELAHHFVQGAAGGDVLKAVELCARAAARAFQQFAYEESARWYERAVQALDLNVPRDEERRCMLLLALGEAWSVSGARDRARATFELAADTARRLSRSDLLARAALGYRAGEMGVPPEDATLALLDEALTALGDRDPGLRAQLLSRLVGTPPHSNSMENRAALAREAHRLACRAGDPAALRDALSARLWANLGPDGIEERLAVARELLVLAERQGDKRLALLGHDGMLGGHLLRGEMAPAEHALAAYTQTARELRQPAYVFQATFWQGSWVLARGGLDEAERLFRQAMALGRGTVPYAHFMFAGQMSLIVYRRAQQADAELDQVFFGEMLALPYSFEYAVRSSLALLRALTGELDACRREFDALAAHGFADLRRDEHWLVALSVLSEVATRLADRERGAQLFELLKPYARLVCVHDLLRSIGGTVASSLGDLAALLDRPEEAVAYYEQAIAQETAMGTVLALLDSYGSYCRFLFRRGRGADQRRAEQMLAETESHAATLGIVRYRYSDTLEGRGKK